MYNLAKFRGLDKSKWQANVQYLEIPAYCIITDITRDGKEYQNKISFGYAIATDNYNLIRKKVNYDDMLQPKIKASEKDLLRINDLFENAIIVNSKKIEVKTFLKIVSSNAKKYKYIEIFNKINIVNNTILNEIIRLYNDNRIKKIEFYLIKQGYIIGKILD